MRSNMTRLSVFAVCLFVLIGFASTVKADATSGKKPDLVIMKDFKVLPESPTSDDEIRIENVRFKNIGEAYLPDGTEITFACKVYNKAGAVAKRCESFSYSYFGIGTGAETPSFPYEVGKLKPGEYRIELICDSVNVIDEESKTNNTASVDVIVAESRK